MIESVEAIASPPAFFDSVDSVLRWTAVTARTLQTGADIASHHASAFLGQQQRDAATDTAPRASDDGNFPFDNV